MLCVHADAAAAHHMRVPRAPGFFLVEKRQLDSPPTEQGETN